MKKISIVLIVMFTFMVAGCVTIEQDKTDLIRDISFSPDGKKLLFNRDKGGQMMLQMYNLNTGELIAYASPAGERWDNPQYSFDGKYIAFVSFPLENNYIVPDKSQIAIMDEDGKNVRKITNTSGYKTNPSFSHSGKKIIFARSDMLKDRPQLAIEWAVYEVDVKTGRETCLTQFKFVSMSGPYYFPDDKTFIFWGDCLSGYAGPYDFYKIEKIRKELQSKYQNNQIYVMQGNEKELKPYIVMPEYQKKFKMYVAGSEYSRQPSLSADGSVLIFAAQGYNPDGSADGGHLYQYSADGNHRNIIQHPATISDIAVSPNNKLLAAVEEPKEHHVNTIVIYRVSDGSIYKEITLPDRPSRIINTQ